MIRETITIEDAVDLLNRMLELDPEATRKLVATRTVCNEKLITDTDIKCDLERKVEYDDDHNFRSGSTIYKIGLLGVLNGLFGSTKDNPWGAIFAEFKLRCSAEASHMVKDDVDIFSDGCAECDAYLELGEIIGFCRSEESFNC